MKILYIFPHPDDESFGPASGMHAQLQQGHEVYLLTLTKGGATKMRHKLGLTIEEMGEVRYKEMLAVEKVLGLSGMEVLDLPDSGLKEMDPRHIEDIIQNHIQKIRPDIVVTYPVHGISGFHDHLVTHAVVKRVYLTMQDNGADYLKRLAFYTLIDSGEPVFQGEMFRMKQSEEALIDCSVPLTQENLNAFYKALDCYETYKETIAASGVKEKTGNTLHYEFFNENFDPPLKDITGEL